MDKANVRIRAECGGKVNKWKKITPKTNSYIEEKNSRNDKKDWWDGCSALQKQENS